MRKIDIWDILFWIGMIILLGWIVLKLFGFINTPEWLNLLPLLTIAYMVGVFYQKTINSFERLYIRTDYLKEKLENHEKRLFSLENKKK